MKITTLPSCSSEGCAALWFYCFASLKELDADTGFKQYNNKKKIFIVT